MAIAIVSVAMPPQASERAVKVASKVLAKIAAYDPYFPKPNQAMLTAWAEHISMKNICEEDMLAGVSKFYESNTEGQKPLPANISLLARELRRERALAEPRESSEAREARIDARVDGATVDLDQKALGGGGVEKISLTEWEQLHGESFPRLAFGKSLDDLDGVDREALKVRCPHCKQPDGSPCTIAGTSELLKKTRSHDARRAVVEGRCAPWAGWHVNPHTGECLLT